MEASTSPAFRGIPICIVTLQGRLYHLSSITVVRQNGFPKGEKSSNLRRTPKPYHPGGTGHMMPVGTNSAQASAGAASTTAPA